MASCPPLYMGGQDATPQDWVNYLLEVPLPEILRGVKVADLVVVLGSIDIIMRSVDR